MARLVSCLKKAFCRPSDSDVRKSDRKQPSSSSSEKPAQETPFQQQARQIAQIPVAGMQRTAGSGPATNFVTTYAPAPGRGPGAAAAAASVQQLGADNATCSTDATLVTNSAGQDDKEELSGDQDLEKHAGASAWKGQANGTAYDKRLELTQEDEDMWARMAM